LIWLRAGTGGGRLWMRQWTCGFHKMRGIAWVNGPHSPVSSFLKPTYLPQDLILSNTLSLCSCLKVTNQVSHPQQAKSETKNCADLASDRNVFVYIYIYIYTHIYIYI
jgi:hypothetical protein